MLISSELNYRSINYLNIVFILIESFNVPLNKVVKTVLPIPNSIFRKELKIIERQGRGTLLSKLLKNIFLNTSYFEQNMFKEFKEIYDLKYKSLNIDDLNISKVYPIKLIGKINSFIESHDSTLWDTYCVKEELNEEIIVALNIFYKTGKMIVKHFTIKDISSFTVIYNYFINLLENIEDSEVLSIYICLMEDNFDLVLLTSKGNISKYNYSSLNKASKKSLFTLETELVSVEWKFSSEQDDSSMYIVSSNRIVRIALEKIRFTKNFPSMGIKGIKLNENSTVSNIIIRDNSSKSLKNNPDLLVISNYSYAKKVRTSDGENVLNKICKPRSIGLKLISLNFQKNNSPIYVKAFDIKSETLAKLNGYWLIMTSKKVFLMSLDELSYCSNRLVKGSKLIDVSEIIIFIERYYVSN